MGTPETQAYCDDVQCIGGLCEFHRKSAVGIGQGGTGNSGTDAQVVKFGLMQALMSRRLSRYVSCAKAIQRQVEM